MKIGALKMKAPVSAGAKEANSEVINNDSTAAPADIKVSMTTISSVLEKRNFGTMTWAQLAELADDPRSSRARTTDAAKKTSPLIAAHNGKTRDKGEAEKALFGLLRADLDKGTEGQTTETIAAALREQGLESFIVHTTLSSTPENPRFRVYLELAEPVPFDVWRSLQLELADVLGSDPCVNLASQFMTLPTITTESGRHYERLIGEGSALAEGSTFWRKATERARFTDTPKRNDVAPAPKGDLVRLESALRAIPIEELDEYNQWLRAIHAVHHESGGSPEGLALAHEFSSWGEYDPDDVDAKWRKANKDKPNGVTAASIYALAFKHGWQDLAVADADLADDAAEEPHDAFYAYLPAHQYLHRPTRAFWPAASVDGHLHYKIDGKKVSTWLDKCRAVHQATWHPAYGELLKDVVVADGGFVPMPGTWVYNRYRPAMIVPSEASPEPWLNHIRTIYPDEADHLIKWFAHRVQRPGDKINHALVLGGSQGIGKDTLLEPVRRGVGPWNWADIDPQKLTGAFNPFVESVVLRINEARDLGDLDRFAFYDHSKTYIAAPPDVLMCNNKHAKEYPVFNVMGVILTTNHKTNGIYLPMDDRRHYVAWSESRKEDFSDEYWCQLWRWIDNGGAEAVVGYLRGLDLSDFNPKAPPPKTEAFFAIVQANSNPDDVALSGLVNGDSGTKPPVVTLGMLAERAEAAGDTDLVIALTDSKQRRRVPHMLERVGYTVVPNPNASDGLWRFKGRRQAIYGDASLSISERVKLARELA